MTGTPSLLLLLSLAATVSSFSFVCVEPYRACYPKCVRPTEACRGECPHDIPVLSEDGKSCSKCDGDFCPKCEKNDYYCKATKKCQKKTAPCGGECLFVDQYPKLNENGTECERCYSNMAWCAKEKKCYHPAKGEPCKGTCPRGVTARRRYCPKTGLCQSIYVPCGGICAKNPYCSKMNRVKTGWARILSKRCPGSTIKSSPDVRYMSWVGPCCVPKFLHDRYCEDGLGSNTFKEMPWIDNQIN